MNRQSGAGLIPSPTRCSRIYASPWLLDNGTGGGVGGFTVQLAKEAGAIVIATASPRSTDTVRAFGADHIVDYTATTIAEAVKDPVDVVVNLVAGSREDTEALPDVTKPGGVLVSATSPGGEFPCATRP